MIWCGEKEKFKWGNVFVLLYGDVLVIRLLCGLFLGCFYFCGGDLLFESWLRGFWIRWFKYFF